jgi:hypothetical protein
LFLFLRDPARSVVDICKVCIDEGLSFISENSGEITLFSFQLKCRGSTEVAQGVRRLVEALEFIN